MGVCSGPAFHTYDRKTKLGSLSRHCLLEMIKYTREDPSFLSLINVVSDSVGQVISLCMLLNGSSVLTL